MSITRALATCTGAPGRFERVAHAGDFAVVVDYAHSDDALLNVLRTAREVTEGRIITVFGCGGDRDGSKRAPMGEAAGSLSDVVILTSDNPRTEDPERILADAELGIQKTGKPYRKIADRREAIHQAVSQARAKDLVLIAGKGHEDYQIIGREVFHFDDKEVAREALAKRAWARPLLTTELAAIFADDTDLLSHPMIESLGHWVIKTFYVSGDWVIFNRSNDSMTR